EREEAPAAAVAKGLRPLRRIIYALGPGLALERRQHAGLRQRGLADAGIAEQHRQSVHRHREGGEHINSFPLSAEEVVAVLFLHRGKATIRRRVAPQLARPCATAGCRVEEPSDVLFG